MLLLVLVLLTTSVLMQREVPATVSSFYVSVVYTAMLRTSIAAVVLGCFYFCPEDCDASADWENIKVAHLLRVLQQNGIYTYLVRAQNFLFHSPFDEIYRCLLLFHSRAFCFRVNRLHIWQHAHGLTCLPIVQANEKAPFRRFFFSFLVAALLLLFTHREGCAEKQKDSFVLSV